MAGVANVSFETPNLASMAAPYIDNYNAILKGAYGFKDDVRTDYLKDLYVPSKALGAQVDTLNNQYALQDAMNTYGMRLDTSYNTSALGAAQAGDAYSTYGVTGPMGVQTSINTAQGDMFKSQEYSTSQRDSLEMRAVNNEAGKLLSEAPGEAPWAKASNAYSMAIGNPKIVPSVREALRTRAIDEVRKQMLTVVPGSREYLLLRDTLVSYGGFKGMFPQPAPAPAPQGNQGWSP